MDDLDVLNPVAELLGEVDAREDLDTEQKVEEKDRVERQAAENAAKPAATPGCSC